MRATSDRIITRVACEAWRLALLLAAAAVLAVPLCSAALYAPNHFLGTCLDAKWVRDVETSLNISSTVRDTLGRLVHPHLHAALPSRRFAVDDPRINGRSTADLYSTNCTATPFKYWGVNATVNATTGALTDKGTADGSLVVELKGWMSSQFATHVFAVLAQEILGYRVSMYKSTNAADMGARMADSREGRCTPIHANVEEWGRSYPLYVNDIYKASTQGYVGRSGLYTTKAMVDKGLQASPAYSADFWRDYAVNDQLIGELDVDLIFNNGKYYPPDPVICADGFRGCRNSCSRTDTCTAREAGGGKCLGLAMMYPTYDDGWAESALANNKVPSYHCFFGADGVEAYAVEMEAADKPVFFFHYEPDPFHYVHANKFVRVFLPRATAKLEALDRTMFGEHGFGTKTDNPLSVDFRETKLSVYGARLLLDHPPVAALLSFMTLSESAMADMHETYVNITAHGAPAIEPDDAAFSSGCQWVRDNYATWGLWLDRLPLCDVLVHVAHTLGNCGGGTPFRTISWAWKEPHPLDATQPYVRDGGLAALPGTLHTSKSCAWLEANPSSWVVWVYATALCDAQFYSFRVSACDAQATRTVTYYWLLVDPADETKSRECVDGVALPEPEAVACEYTPRASPLFQAMAVAAAALAVVLVGMLVFVVVYRKEPIIKRSQFEFLLVMILGGELMCVAAVAYAGEPSTLLCGARPAVTAVGFTLIFGALVVKSLRVYRVFLSGAMKRVVLPTSTMFKILGALLSVDALILLAWFVADFPAPHWEPRALGALPIERHVCHSSSFIFSALLIFWKAIVLLAGLCLSFLIRNVSSDFQESIWIFASSLVVLLCSVIILPMAYLVELPATVFYAFLAAMLLVCTAVVMGMMLVPKVRRLHEATTAEKDSNSDSTRHGSGGSSPRKGTKFQLSSVSRKNTTQITPVEEFREPSMTTASRSVGKTKAESKTKSKTKQPLETPGAANGDDE